MLIDFYQEKEVEVKDEDGNVTTVMEDVLTAEDAVVRRVVSLSALYPQECYKIDGTIYEDRVRVYDDVTKEQYVIKGSYSDFKSKIINAEKKVGFT